MSGNSIRSVSGLNVLGGKKSFDRGVPLYFQIELIMNFIPNESPSKMGFLDTK